MCPKRLRPVHERVRERWSWDKDGALNGHLFMELQPSQTVAIRYPMYESVALGKGLLGTCSITGMIHEDTACTRELELGNTREGNMINALNIDLDRC